MKLNREFPLLNYCRKPVLPASLLAVAVLLACCVDDPVTPDRNVAITIDIQGNGSVEGFSSDTTVKIGEQISVAAVPDSGYIFTGWQVDRIIMSNPLTMTVNKDYSITARFAKKPAGMVFIPSLDTVFTMGSSHPTAQEFERPPHKIRFGHDFYISPYEVTRGEYANIMQQTVGGGDRLPVGGVSWYDAVLFCNALSKSQGYDTVYSFTSICRSDSTCPFVLENLKINYDKFGYRLPTEAEWEYACRGGTAAEYFWGDDDAEKYAWYSVNSADQAHTVGEKLPNPFGLYDMCGNAAEWVNDWLESYPDTLLCDPVGPTSLTQEEFESSWERPLRGGSFRLELPSLRSSTRRGPYATSAFMVLPDIGFRVALGAFEAATFKLSIVNTDSLDVSSLCSKTDLIGFIGTSRIKLALVSVKNRNRNLYIANFCGTGISIDKCGSDRSVYSPTISPDGKFVAYSSRGEGFSGVCTLTIRPTDCSDTSSSKINGFLPRWWVSPDALDTFVVYTSGASLNNLSEWYTEKTYRQRIQGGKPAGQPEILWPEGSYHGGLSSDGRFLATAYPVAKLVDLQINDTNIFYFSPPYNGRTDNAQVCNLSISPSRSVTDEAMFLDFGYPGVSTLLGKPYGLHSVIFVCNSKLFSYDHVSRWFECPSPYIQWNYTEWSNHPDFAVSLANTADYSDNAVFAIKLSDSSYFTICKSSTASDPFLWIDPSEVSEQPDPYRFFGKYDIPVQTSYQQYAAKKFRLFWYYRQELECLVVGSSPAFYGIAPDRISQRTLNMSRCGGGLLENMFVINNYILPHCPNVKALIIELTPYTFDQNPFVGSTPMGGLYESKGMELDTAMHFYQSGLPEAIHAKINAYSNADWTELDSGGYFLNKPQGTGWSTFAPVRKGDYDFNDSVVQASLASLTSTVDKATSLGVKVLVVNFPQDPSYKDSVMMGCLGPSYATYGKIVAVLDSLEQGNSNFHFYDAGKNGNHDYTDNEAFDSNHLNYLGAQKLSARLDSVVAEVTQ